ncbi:MAG: uroporphyrinogen-III synthase [Candidatus Methanomethylophilaceae archaeon]|nr:uroporphyrinogen-III synthase [Candidatus Methanomethylophilaceae archaeon]
MTRLGFMRTTRRLVDSVKEAEAMGFTVMAAPAVTIIKGDDREFAKISDAVAAGRPVAFMTSTAVEECSDHFKDSFKAMFKGGGALAAGTAAECLRHFGISPAGEDAEGALKAGPEGDPDAEAALYKAVPAGIGSPVLHMMIAVKRGELDWLAFTSPTSADSFFGFMDSKYGVEASRAYLDDNVKVAAVDSRTAERLKALGRGPDLVASEPTFHGLLQAVKDSERSPSDGPLPLPPVAFPDDGPGFHKLGHDPGELAPVDADRLGDLLPCPQVPLRDDLQYAVGDAGLRHCFDNLLLWRFNNFRGGRHGAEYDGEAVPGGDEFRRRRPCLGAFRSHQPDALSPASHEAQLVERIGYPDVAGLGAVLSFEAFHVPAFGKAPAVYDLETVGVHSDLDGVIGEEVPVDARVQHSLLDGLGRVVVRGVKEHVSVDESAAQIVLEQRFHRLPGLEKQRFAYGLLCNRIPVGVELPYSDVRALDETVRPPAQEHSSGKREGFSVRDAERIRQGERVDACRVRHPVPFLEL